MLDCLGVPVAVHRSNGNGPPAVLLHGNSLSAASFAPQLDSPLGERFALHAIDFPGHGASGRMASLYSMPGFASVTMDVMRQLGIADAPLVGWSLGGHVA